ncbi:MAG: hypothetical protein A3J07_00545 [Candidatus Doudnabacteria bacterium RIFCSPLOWO2_02_FULL_49_13]|uniref:Uncharacterized protein n=1 Tax=Candidatus Doudnabacteria bacterium RIFCSPHIGHO2_12_FULL_48_16 TaxID=1817838 RepID=A0A1F5PJX6_9BACT|nr:MAG: hypothetical protein A3B77_03460 [Candidatus Doudnabacteria bacterium RIFCSPHIGHO2_02_FULL_49_24]OGE88495.1 MAG: hypothetical protein A2760_00195 [Candidatus Doudnabacteria bacterium RIFCSPHIGHO2_01_FULL_50_67]OGE90243.1 MAG: hypothetical protein A3E29_04055 [Candidatus Doudnabacteria bacterium RIFCSPHIGHO2_12_FULL_48_16]OGE96900.1 MAG: hypothetical protein A2990_03845 [Candidatus Doudnabacteria bacterium RIFCSPLOWO2_01_FULL_49_40]OGF02299.1 MAG: hypothetical protein A3J07_00545 [Candid
MNRSSKRTRVQTTDDRKYFVCHAFKSLVRTFGHELVTTSRQTRLGRRLRRKIVLESRQLGEDMVKELG